MSNIFTWYVALAERRTSLLLLALGCLAVLCLIPASRLELHTDMAELLPDNHPGVIALRRISGRQISSTNLVMIIESPDRMQNRKLAEALRPELTRMVPSVFTEVHFQPESEVPEFANRWKWLYAPKGDLESAEDMLDRLVAQRKQPLAVNLEGDPEEELRALRKRLNQKLPERVDAPYFEVKDQKGADLWYLGIMLWRRGDGLATLGDQQTLKAVQDLVGRMDLKAFHPQMKVEYSGHIAMAIDEQNAVRDDLTLATTVCVSLVLLAIWAYFRRVAILWVVGAPAVLGVLMSLALARFTVGFLNANTAFLISIILGNGINTPIILLARYGEERRLGLSVTASMEKAMTGTLRATLTAMAAASIAYGCLLFTSLRGLNQFGLVGGAGMIFSWTMSFLLVPPMVIFGERLRPGVLTPGPHLWERPFALIGRLAERAPRLFVLFVVISVGAAAVPACRYARDPLEYNFDNLRTQDKDASRRWAIMYDLGMGNVGAGHIARDGVILVDTPDQADIVARALWEQELAKGEGRILESVRTMSSILPQDQKDKLEILGRIRRKIDRNKGLMSDEEWREISEWRPPDYLRELRIPDLPKRLRDNFTEVDGTMGRLIGIDADWRRYVDGDGRELIRLSKAMQVTVLGKTWVAAATATVFAGMLETIVADGPTVTIAALLGVMLLVGIAFGPRAGLPVLITLFIGLAWLVGLLGVMKEKLNFLNFVAIPITLGIGTEYAVNLWARVRKEGRERLSMVIASTGSAVALCSLTTIIGYSSLLLARSRALQSFGIIADLGEVTCLLAALVGLPAVVFMLRAAPKERSQA